MLLHLEKWHWLSSIAMDNILVFISLFVFGFFPVFWPHSHEDMWCGNTQTAACLMNGMDLEFHCGRTGYADFLFRQSGWTSSVDVFFNWLSSLTFEGGGFGEAAIAEALAEALMVTILTSSCMIIPLGF